MTTSSLLSLASAAIFFVIGLTYVLRPDVLVGKGRGTALKLSPRGHRVLGTLFLVLAAVIVLRIVLG